MDGCNIQIDTPKVSVIMPCYNEPTEIFCRSLESVIHQTLEDIEIIIVLDNPNNEPLRETIRGYTHTCDRILFLDPGKNLGKGPARNLAIKKATGRYIAVHDADDIDVEDRLEKQYTLLESIGGRGLTIGKVRYVDDTGIPTDIQAPKRDHRAKSILRKPFNHPTLFMSTEMVRGYEGYRDISYGQDYDLFLRMVLGGENLVYSDEVYTDYLAPVKSTHNDFTTKMKKTKLLALKRLINFMAYPEMYKDPYYYILFLKYIAALGILYTCPSKFEQLRAFDDKMSDTVSKTIRRIRI